MARAVVGGLITSTFLTLLVVPVVYTLLDDFAAWMRRRWDGKKAAAGAVVGLLVLLHGIPSLGPPAAAAADSAAVEILTLDEALRAAVANNRDVAKAMELRTFLEGKYVEERAAALPQFLGNRGGASRLGRKPDPSSAYPPASNRYTAQVGVSQPLYSSGAVAAGIRAAGKGLATADDRLRIARHAVLRDVYAAFHDILLGRELNRIAVEDRAQKARHLDEARKKYAAGTATDYDVLAAEVALRNAGPEVVRTENSIRIVPRAVALPPRAGRAGGGRERRPVGRGGRPSELRQCARDGRGTSPRAVRPAASPGSGAGAAGDRPRREPSPAGFPRRSRLAGDRLRGRRHRRKDMVRGRVRLLAPLRRTADARPRRPGGQRRAHPPDRGGAAPRRHRPRGARRGERGPRGGGDRERPRRDGGPGRPAGGAGGERVRVRREDPSRRRRRAAQPQPGAREPCPGPEGLPCGRGGAAARYGDARGRDRPADGGEAGVPAGDGRRWASSARCSRGRPPLP